MTGPTFHDYAWVVVNSSAGKDSQTALRRVVETARRQQYPLERVVVSHQDLGDIEWPGTLTLARLQARIYGLRFEVSRYRDRSGQEIDLLEYAIRRGKWPSNNQRWCTSEFKRAPGNRVLTKLGKERAGDILQVFGFRAEESPARRRKVELAVNPRASTGRRTVFDWLPILQMREAEVWRDIHDSGVPYHHAYDLGMRRLSCRFCIYAPPGQLMISAEENPDLFARYLLAEKEMGHRFTDALSLADVEAMMVGGAPIPEDEGEWNM